MTQEQFEKAARKLAMSLLAGLTFTVLALFAKFILKVIEA